MSGWGFLLLAGEGAGFNTAISSLAMVASLIVR